MQIHGKRIDFLVLWNVFKTLLVSLKITVSKKVVIKSTCLDPMCSTCGNPTAKIEIVGPNAYPQDALKWKTADYIHYDKFRNFNSNYLIYSGPGGNNGYIGDPIDLNRKAALIDAFTAPYNPIEMREQFYDMAGYCAACDAFYCSKHWSTTTSGYGKCPKGHGKSLDPHWSPDIE
ncbi:hypothetical protein MACH07_24780 [Flagellimonas marinaquae]|uniref:Uncharacterized protein n=1 Tax=Flagellimonas marinaquae TaxID=254955 RepID=A0AA48I0T7_9FLAO|nr:hypothetical protein MACH07_24780 [Allomuricauda aquimarina]